MKTKKTLLTRCRVTSYLALTGALLLTGCTTGDSTRTSGGQSPSESVVAREGANRGPTTMEETERGYAISPRSAQTLGYRIDWQAVGGMNKVETVTLTDESAYLLDEQNFLVRLRENDGKQLWRAPVSDPVDQIFGLNDIAEENRVYVTLSGSLLELDRSTGGILGRQQFQRIANTAPVQVGQFLVYGSRNGQVIWHSYKTAFQWRATQVANTIKVQPVLNNNNLVAVGGDGEVMVLNAMEARGIWNTKLLDEVVAAPVAGPSVLYVAGTDQHLRAFDLRTGRGLWKVLTPSVLKASPTLMENRLYQQIPAEGLVCYDALPFDSPGGKVIWEAPDVSGSVLTRHGRDLITWDDDGHVLQVVDATYGTLKHTMKLPRAQQVYTTALDKGDLYVLDYNGTLTRLVSRN